MLNEELMERVLSPNNVQAAYEHVKANGGAPGVDGMAVEAYAEHAVRHWRGSIAPKQFEVSIFPSRKEVKGDWASPTSRTE